jgi:hypothetical protein
VAAHQVQLQAIEMLGCDLAVRERAESRIDAVHRLLGGSRAFHDATRCEQLLAHAWREHHLRTLALEHREIAQPERVTVDRER